MRINLQPNDNPEQQSAEFDSTKQLIAEVSEELAGMRLDQAVAQLFPDYSRSQLTQAIRAGDATVDGAACKPKQRMYGGEKILLTITVAAPASVEPEAMDLNVVYEDEEMIIINKPAGLVVHPGTGNASGTLQNGLLHYAEELQGVPRAGLIHRLDKDTSGLLVIARTIGAHTTLTETLACRDMHRFYDCTVLGRMVAGGTVDEPMGRHKVDRIKMAVRPDGKPAVTHYRIHSRYRAHTRLRVQLETGRTHQIRVHMAHLRHAIVGDPVYGGRLAQPPYSSEEFVEVLRNFKRQALHAVQLEVPHPTTGEMMTFDAPVPADMLELDAAMQADTEANANQDL